MAIRSFRDRGTKDLFEELNTKAARKRLPKNLHAIAATKLAFLDACVDLQGMAVIPGLRLERLRGGRGGQHSIRINEQFRICFVWRDGDAFEVEITDYH